MLLTDCRNAANGLRMRGEYVYAGTMNRPLRLLVVCRNAANGLLIMERPPTKCATNTLYLVGE